tara:strand:- start:240 stop:677 length:438 start_codon:yes stop_codon:yes gene_type:complete
MNDLIINILSVLYVVVLPAYIAKKLSDNHGKNFIKSYLKGFFSLSYLSGTELWRLNDKMKFQKSQAEFSKKMDEDLEKLQTIIDKEKEPLKQAIVEYLKLKGEKLPASDIDFQLKVTNVDHTKECCEELYRDGVIGRTSNYRYFI